MAAKGSLPNKGDGGLNPVLNHMYILKFSWSQAFKMVKTIKVSIFQSCMLLCPQTVAGEVWYIKAASWGQCYQAPVWLLTSPQSKPRSDHDLLIQPPCLILSAFFMFSQSQSIHHISLPKTIPTFLFLSRGMFHMKLCPLYPGLSFHNGTQPKYPNTAGWN